MSLIDDYLFIAHRLDRKAAEWGVPQLPGTILDVGAGYQPYRLLTSAESTYLALDPDTSRRPDIVGSVLDLPVKSSTVSSVICSEVLEHVPEPDRAMAEIARVLRPGGLLYLTVPQSWGLHYEPDDYFRFTKYGIRVLLERHGLQLQEYRQIGGLFSHFAVRLIDLIVARAWLPTWRKLGLRRGGYRAAAVLLAPLNLMLAPLTGALDRLDPFNAYAWAVIASKPAEAGRDALDEAQPLEALLACPACREPLERQDQTLACVGRAEHRFALTEGIPVLLVERGRT